MNSTTTTTDYVIEDLKERESFGFKKYGKYLTTKTNEDMLQHLYEELLDASVYIKTLINQRNEIDKANKTLSSIGKYVEGI